MVSCCPIIAAAMIQTGEIRDDGGCRWLIANRLSPLQCPLHQPLSSIEVDPRHGDFCQGCKSKHEGMIKTSLLSSRHRGQPMFLRQLRIPQAEESEGQGAQVEHYVVVV